jgi:hypothetical protein
MNDEISQKNEELRYIKNDTLDCDRQRDLLKEEIKKSNKNVSDLNVIFSLIVRKKKKI